MDIKESLAKHRDELLQRPGVVGVGIGFDQGQEVIVVMVRDRASSSLPATVEDHRLVVQEAGDVVAF